MASPRPRLRFDRSRFLGTSSEATVQGGDHAVDKAEFSILFAVSKMWTAFGVTC